MSSSNDKQIRLSKLMSDKGICSRREADRYIEQGLVYVNGEKITQLGTKVDPSVRVTLEKSALDQQKELVTIILNKPIGYVSSQPEPPYEPAIRLITPENFFIPPSKTADLKSSQNKTFDKKISNQSRNSSRLQNQTHKKLKPEHFDKLAVAGRLDIDSQGLLIFTQDGRLAKKIIGENSEVEKEYLVRVEGSLSKEDLKLLNYGLSLDGKKLKPAKVEWINQDQLKFILTEGKKRQVRRMCELVGLKVTGLKRVRIGDIKLGNLPEGKWRFLD